MELSPPDPRIGQVLQGRYRILERVAAGAMGVVYRGERVELARPVAVKFLHPWIAAQQAFRMRFETEARAMSRLGHPNCVSVIDFGIEGSPYVVMDFVAGSTLRELLGRGRLPPARAVAIARQLLAGVAHAHEQGIIHRDLKPENLILGDTAGLTDHVRILDFGLAKLRDGPAMTSGLAIGTPSYMSPEQTGAPGEIDGRTDIYAVGVLLFEMLAGRKPFVSDKVAEILLMHRDSPPPSVRATVPEAAISGALEGVIYRALAKTPETRFQTAAEFAQALDQVPEAVAARARGHFPSTPSTDAPAPKGVGPIGDGDKTIADPAPAHLAGAAPTGLPSAPSWHDGAGSEAVKDAGGERSVMFRLTGARWLGLAAVGLLALVLVLFGVRHRPAAPRAVGKVDKLGAAGGTIGGIRAGASAITPGSVTPASGAAVGRPVAAVAPAGPSADERLASAAGLVASGEWEQAMVVLEKARRENPQSAVVAYELANLALAHKRWAEGAQAARVAAEREPKYRADERLVKNLIRSLASDKGYEKTEDVLHGFGAGPIPFLKDAAAHDKSPTVRQRAADLLRSRGGSRVGSRASSTTTRKSSSRSLFSR